MIDAEEVKHRGVEVVNVHGILHHVAAELASLHKIPKEGLLNSRAVWKDLAHTVFNMKEFIYLR